MVKYSLFGSWYGNYLKTTIGLQNNVALNFVQFFLDHSVHFSPTRLLADILDVANTPRQGRKKEKMLSNNMRAVCQCC